MTRALIACLVGFDLAHAAFKTGHEHKRLSRIERIEVGIAFVAIIALSTGVV